MGAKAAGAGVTALAMGKTSAIGMAGGVGAGSATGIAASAAGMDVSLRGPAKMPSSRCCTTSIMEASLATCTASPTASTSARTPRRASSRALTSCRVVSTGGGGEVWLRSRTSNRARAPHNLWV
jgi:hypothetical protein